MPTEETRIPTFDGLNLAATIMRPDCEPAVAAVLVHGGGVDRHEAGFFDRLAGGLGSAGAVSLQFDLRGHGESEGRQEDLTIAAVLSDIDAAVGHVREAAGGTARVALIGASFAGGACAAYAARKPLDSLTLLNPQTDYRARILSRGHWKDGRLTDEAASDLNQHGYIQFTPSLRHGRPLLNEALWLDTGADMDGINVPTLIVHGDADTLVPVRASRDAARRIPNARLVEVPGAQHGFAVHDDPTYADPRSQDYQRNVIRIVSDWVRNPGR